jgi:cobalt-precorrin-7 (C5)-methyltransferase
VSGDADPAALAAAAPEPDDPTDPVHAVGVGPGAREYLTPRAERAVAEADVVVGFETVLGVVDDLAGETLSCGYDDQTETLAAFGERVAAGESGTAVLMGDPNHSGYQLLGRIERAVEGPVRVVPGVSALQVAASRARTPMEASTFVTLHRRGPLDDALARLERDAGTRHLLVLPRPFDLMPGDVAARLVEGGADPTLDAVVYERLTLADERTTHATLAGLAAHAGEESPFSDLSVLVVRRG